MDIETVSDTSTSSRFHRWLALLVGVSAIGAALIATLQLDAGKREERALLMASRLSVEAFEKIAGSGALAAFAYTSSVQGIVLSVEGLGRGISVLEDPRATRADRAASRAEIEAGDRLKEVAASMSATPEVGGPVDDHTVDVLAAATGEIAGIVEEENRQVDVADRYSARGARAVFGLSLLAIAAVLLALAGVLGEQRPGVIALVSASVALVLSFGWAGSALLI
jgi:hypothetical protein